MQQYKKKIEKLDCLNLEELYLGNNKIKYLENLDHLFSLHTLSLQSNAITYLDCKNLPRNIKNLLLSENKDLKIIKNLDYLVNLEYLDVSNTKIKECDLKPPDGLEIIFD